MTSERFDKVGDDSTKLLQLAYELFSGDHETDEVGTDAWAWKERTRTHLETLSAGERCSIPIDMNMVLNAKEAEKANMTRIMISVPIKDILYATPSASEATRELLHVLEAARDYTTERQYQNVEACRRDQDQRERVLIHAIRAADKALKP